MPTAIASAPRTRVLVLAMLLVAGITYSLSQTLILPALPQLSHALGIGPATSSWLLTAHLLSSAVCTPLVGKLGDLYGRARLLAVVGAVFAVGSIMSTTHSPALAILGRVLQGFAGGVFPLAYGVIRDTFPPEQLPMAVGALSISVGVGAGFGPALAGIVVEHAGPSAIFWVGVVGAVPMLFAPLVIHDRPDSARTPLDLPGALLLSTALIALLLAISTSGEHRAVTAVAGGLGVLAIVAMVVWVRVERRVPDPLIRLEVLTNRTVALVNAIAACVGFATFVVYSSVAPFLQAPESTGYGFGMSVAVSGAWLIPHGVLLMAIAPLAGWACKHRGPRLVLLVGTFGTTLCAASFTLFHGSVAAIVIPVSVLGAAHGCTLTAMANLVVDAVRPEEIGVSTGLNMVARTLGMAFGAAISAAVLAAGVREATGLTGAGSYTITYAIAGLAAAGAAACAVAVRPARRPVAATPPAAVLAAAENAL